jgi:hypothetical protein
MIDDRIKQMSIIFSNVMSHPNNDIVFRLEMYDHRNTLYSLSLNAKDPQERYVLGFDIFLESFLFSRDFYSNENEYNLF